MPQTQQRTLKIEATGDFWRGRIKPRIRLGGNWLQHAGFEPGQHVRVTSQRPGELTLQLIGAGSTEANTHA